MSDFVTFFPSREHAQPPASFSELGRIFRDPLRADHVQAEVLHGAAILRTRSFGRMPQFYAREDGSGWIVVKGQIFDVSSQTPAVDLKELLHHFLTENSPDLNRYEGSFALAVWDARKRLGWVVNDQTSLLNLYYGVYDAGLYVSTNAISLARALDLSLDARGVQEFLARGVLLAPTTMFAGLRRLNTGEHVRFRAGKVFRTKHWHAYEPEASHRSLRDAADAAAAVVMDRVARYHATAGPVVCDITSGLDSRLAVVAADAAGLKPALTVNGLPDDRDVRIAHQVAEALQWDLRCFDTRSLWTVEITPDVRRELLYRTSGELPFTRIYTHMLSRPRLAQDFNLHTQGSGGELFRYFPWGQELLGVGRRRLANVDNVLKYRLLKDVPPPSLFSQDWLPGLHENLRSRIEAICRERSRTRTTQQLDAIHIWKSTSHSTLYISAICNWLPSAAPLLSAGVVKVATSMPWIMRLSSQLQRHIIYALSPRAARVVSTCDGKYGGPAEPTSFKNLHFAVWRGIQSGGHLATKFERILLKGAFRRRLSSTTSGIQKHIPFVTREFQEVLAPETMLSRALYTREGLRRVLSGTDEDWQARESSITKLATIEQLCRELDFEPEEDFLASAPLERPDMPS